MNNDLLGTTNGGTISLNPWRTITEIMKLSGYAAIAWMTYSLSRRPENARKLFNAVIAIGGFYAFYAFVLAISNTSQLEIFGYPPPSLKRITGPFVLHNSFATYCGLAAIAAGLKLVEKGAGAVVADRGWRKLSLTLMQFLFGKGLPVFCAFVLLFSAVIASASRAGTVSLLCGLIAVSLLSLAVGRGKIARGWGSLAVFAALTPILIMLLFGGEQLGNRFASLLSDGQADEIRLALWAACQRMIEFAPWLGLGLGTFQDSYPLYAEKVFPFVMDKAHSDYLELAAGLGLPAAIAWWGALIWLAARCLRGVFVRRRDRIYAAAAVGASVLVAVHSSVDFSLQIPAVAISFAVILGIGVAQSIPTRKV